MATKTFKIGLSNTDKQNMAQDIYERVIALTFSEYDSSETYNKGDFVVYDNALYQCLQDNVSGAWDSTKWQSATLQDLLDDVEGAVASVDNKANVDGNYQTMTVGLANNLDSKLVENDQSAYNFRPTATMGSVELEVGSPCKVKSIVGGTVAFNQIFNIYGTTETISDVTFTNNNDGSWTINGTASADITTKSLGTVKRVFNHKVLLIGCPAGGGLDTYYLRDGTAGINDTGNGAIYTIGSTNEVAIAFIIKSGVTLNNVKVHPQYIDLTQMFGSTIADYIYSLETATPGAGVAWFKRYFPNTYYAYNSGTLVNVQTSGKKIVKFNQWDEEWENGYWDSTGKHSNANYVCNKTLIKVIPNTTYYAKTPVRLDVMFYDQNGNFINHDDNVNNDTFITPSNCVYIGFANYLSGSLTSYNHDICINFHYDGERDGEYEPYDSETYPIESIELKGIPQLDSNNNLVFDGDEYESNGNVNVKYASVTFDGSVDENWALADAGQNRYRWNAAINNVVKKTGNNAIPFNAIATRFVVSSYSNMTSNAGDFIGIDLDGYLNIRTTNSSITDLASFKTWLSNNNVVLVYELATPTTDSADAFTETQECDNWGTEQFLAPATDTRPCEVPVGHNTDYLPDLKAKLESAPTTPSDDGYYVLEHNESADGNPNLYTALGAALAELGYVKLTEITGYDATKTQTLKNVEGTLTWVDDE